MSIAAERDQSVIELTTRSVIAGVLFGVIFGAANAYLGLKVGLTVSTSIPIAVLTVALFKLMPGRRDGVILDANISQTIGSASSSLATGTIFTIPALPLWGMAPPFWQVAVLALLGGFLGIAAIKLAIGAFVLIPSGLAVHLPVLAKAELALELAPALLAVGYILGYKQSAIMWR